MAGYPWGAGNLGSYMGGRGGGETPSQSSTAGNGQAILLLFVAGAICAVLLSSKVGQSTSGGTGGDNSGYSQSIHDGRDDDSADHDESGDGRGGSSMSGGYSQDDDSAYDVAYQYNSLEDLDLDNLSYKLGSTKTWVKMQDDDLILKVLENKTFENSVEDDFGIEVTKLRDIEKGRAEYLVELNMKENEQQKEIYIKMITSYDVGGIGTNHDVPNTNSKKFIIIASDKLKEVRITTKDKVVVAGGDIKISNIARRGGYLLFDVTSINGIGEVQLIDSNNLVISARATSNRSGRISIPYKEDAQKIRVIDKNGFMTQESIQ